MTKFHILILFYPFDKTFSTKQSIYTIIFLEKVKSKIYTKKKKITQLLILLICLLLFVLFYLIFSYYDL